MGAAKRRGTFEERKARSIERLKLEERVRQAMASKTTPRQARRKNSLLLAAVVAATLSV
jgi:hypothetical protein